METKTQQLKFVRAERNSSNYGITEKFKKLLNRKIIESHIKNLMESMKINGFLGSIIFIQTKAFDTALSIYNADGQNRLEAARRLGIPFNYEVHELIDDTKENVTKLISLLNSVVIRWSTKNFLAQQVALGKKSYILLDKIKEETKLTVTDLLNIFLSGAGSVEVKQFRSGEMKFENVKESMELLNSVKKMKDVLPNKAFSRRAMFKVLKSVKDHKKLAELVKSSSIVFTENEAGLEKQLLSLYQWKNTTKSKLKKAA